MAKIDRRAKRPRVKSVPPAPMNSILAAASTAHDLDLGHKTVLEAERNRALAKKLAGRTRRI
jgi:hypothetical protein